MATTMNITTENVRLDEWLQRVLPHARTELVTDHPWAQTYRVSSDDETFYLKVLPAEQRSALAAMPLLARCFPGVVPEVIAYDVQQGRLLLKDHGGRDIGGSANEAEWSGVLRTYATLQAAARRDADLLTALPTFDFSNVTATFCDYFDPKGSFLSGQVGAAHFLGNDRAQFYYERLSCRSSILQQKVLESIRLPATINHGDLRMQNTAVTSDGSFILFDWDEATVGPAGLSLHNFFSGCSAVAEMLLYRTSDSAAGSTRHHALLEEYVQTLVQAGYANRELIEHALPGTVCAGVMHYLLSYGKFPLDNEEEREQVAKIFVRRLDDLLSFCDLCIATQRETVVHCVDDYEAADAPERARYLLERYLQNVPTDVELQSRLGFVLRYLGDDEAAETLCRRGLDSDPTHAELRYLLGRMFVDRFKFEEAVDQLRLAAHFAPDDEEVRRQLTEADLLLDLQRRAAQPGCVPTIRFTPAELASGSVSKAKRRLAGRMFAEYGTLIVENVFPVDLMDRLAAEFVERYRAYLTDDRPEDALKVGNKRFMITVDLAGPFNTPELYAAPLLTPILARLLGDEFILGSFTAVASLPGAADMRMHKDHPALFDDAEVSGPLPTVAVTTLIPLRGFDLVMGTTRVVKGSHRRSSEEAAQMEWQDPCAPKGSCLLMDYRLSHQGLANRSSWVRPVLSVVYNRPWFRDSVNYELQEPLRMSREELDRTPDNLRRMFAALRTS